MDIPLNRSVAWISVARLTSPHASTHTSSRPLPLPLRGGGLVGKVPSFLVAVYYYYIVPKVAKARGKAKQIR